MSHIPGPWKCLSTSYHAHDYRLTKPNGDPLEVHASANDHTEQYDTAQLISAAPELLAALITLVDHAEETYPHFESARGQADIAAAKAAIQKAQVKA